MEFKKISVNGIQLRYLDFNSEADKCLVFLHGWGGSLDSWQDFLALFEGENIRILAFDLPGFGQSPAPRQAWTVNDYSFLLKDFLAKLGLSKIGLFGHSFGGQIAARFAHDNPETVSKLFLSGAAVIRPKPSFYKIILGFMAKVFKIILLGKASRLRRFIYRLIGSVDYGNLTNPAMRQTMQNVIRDDLTALLPELKVPVVLIWGKQDSYTPYRHYRLIKEKLPRAKSYVFEGGKHGLHLQKPAELKDIILANL